MSNPFYSLEMSEIWAQVYNPTFNLVILFLLYNWVIKWMKVKNQLDSFDQYYTL